MEGTTMQGIHFGLTGLAVMGQNLARNVARHGFPIVVHNRTQARTEEFLQVYGSEGRIIGATDVASFVSALQPPRAILIMVKAGPPIDEVISQLKPHLDRGDVLIDGGNSFYTDTQRRLQALATDGILYLGTGISGGEEGALHGPSIMPGGSRAAYDIVAPIFTTIAAQVDGRPCCTYIGAGGAGHYVKMVHNGIEYADMQLIAEAYDLLKNAVGLSNANLAQTFREWDQGDLDSFLIQITAQIFQTKDPDTGDYLVDRILDKAEQKGTGKWTSQSALDLGVPVTAITEAVFARFVSALKDQRVQAARLLPGPIGRFQGEKEAFVNAIREALYASKVVAYAQGFEQMLAAGQEHGWDLHPDEIASIWRGGCIIRARFLDRIKEAFDDEPQLPNLLLAPYFREIMGSAQESWRRVVGEATRLGIPIPALSSALAYYDGYRRARLPANLIQAQRDLFGAHTFERLDKPGVFHFQWTPAGG
ncbi:MAG: NADP-dependent phosphogluconate dehydrogenase [Candidatus Entotheonellia bacterium]